jgi:hypothetical protein
MYTHTHEHLTDASSRCGCTVEHRNYVPEGAEDGAKLAADGANTAHNMSEQARAIKVHIIIYG